MFGAVSGSVFVASGATVQLNPGGATTYAGKQIILNGNGLGLFFSGLLAPIGALQNAPVNSVANTWTGTIVLNTDSTISAAVNNLTVTGAIVGSGSLTKVGANTLFVGAASAYTGATTVSAGTLSVNGVGQILATSGVTLNPSPNAVTVGTLNLDNTGTNLTGRLMSPSSDRRTSC